MVALSKHSQVLLPDVHKWPDHSQVTIPGGERVSSIMCPTPPCLAHTLNGVVCLHGPQEAIVEGTHEEALSQVVKMLPQCQHVVALTSGTSIQPSTLHP